MHTVFEWKLPTQPGPHAASAAGAARFPADPHPASAPTPAPHPAVATPIPPTLMLDAPSFASAPAADRWAQLSQTKTLPYPPHTPASPPRRPSRPLRPVRARPPLGVTCMLVVAMAMLVTSGGMAIHALLELV